MKVLPNPMDFPAECAITLTASAVCPVTRERDEFTLTVRYRPTTVVLEFESFREWVGRFAGQPLYHEQIVAYVRAALVELLEPVDLEVWDHYHRAGLDYEVRAVLVGSSQS